MNSWNQLGQIGTPMWYFWIIWSLQLLHKLSLSEDIFILIGGPNQLKVSWILSTVYQSRTCQTMNETSSSIHCLESYNDNIRPKRQPTCHQGSHETRFCVVVRTQAIYYYLSTCITCSVINMSLHILAIKIMNQRTWKACHCSIHGGWWDCCGDKDPSLVTWIHVWQETYAGTSIWGNTRPRAHTTFKSDIPYYIKTNPPTKYRFLSWSFHTHHD